ncbi:MAG TPA: metal-dependent transcriptional regulator [Chloroflexota bacterium]
MAERSPSIASEGEHVTPAIQEYLDAIYNMQAEGKTVIAARLAERLGVTPPTVAATLKRMVAEDLVHVDERREIHLTPKGRELAELLVRRHRLVERLLTDLLGLKWHEAHEEAARLEHAISPKLEEQIDRALGHPTTCPHGNPIPGTAAAHRPPGVPLDTLAVGATAVVDRIPEEGERDPRFLAFLQDHGILPGTRLTVLETLPIAGTLTVAVDSTSVVLGLAAAGKVWVHPVDDSVGVDRALDNGGARE